MFRAKPGLFNAPPYFCTPIRCGGATNSVNGQSRLKGGKSSCRVPDSGVVKYQLVQAAAPLKMRFGISLMIKRVKENVRGETESNITGSHLMREGRGSIL